MMGGRGGGGEWEDIDFKHGRIVPEGSYRKLKLPYCDVKEAVGVSFSTCPSAEC